MRRRICALFVAMALGTSLMACGSSNSSSTAATNAGTAATTAKAAETKQATTATETKQAAATTAAAASSTVDANASGGNGKFTYKKIFSYPDPTPINKQAPIEVTKLKYKQGDVPTIAFMPAGLEYSYYQAMAVGVKAAGEQLGAKVVVLAPQQGSDINGQVGMMQDAIQQGVDCILLNPHDDSAAAPLVDQAIAAGIPVFNVNSDSTDWETNLSGVVGYAQKSSNKEQGEMVAEKFKDKQLNIGILEGLPGYHSTQRCGGFQEGIAKHSNYKIIASLNGQWNVDGGYQAGMDMLQAHPEINMIYCANDQEGEGLMQALKSLNRTDVTIVGNDGDTQALEAIYDGTFFSTVNTVPYEMGEYACQAAIDALCGKFTGGFVQTPAYVTTKDNVLKFLQQPERLSPAPSKKY